MCWSSSQILDAALEIAVLEMSIMCPSVGNGEGEKKRAAEAFIVAKNEYKVLVADIPKSH